MDRLQRTALQAATTAQGYMAAGAGMSGNNGNVTCASDAKPCAPISSTASTVAAGTNLQSYCGVLLASSDGTIVRAGQACQNGGTNRCTYDQTSRSVSCPLQPAARPVSAAWYVGAYQYSAQSGALPPNPPTSLVAMVN
jgi:hypothetical protein